MVATWQLWFFPGFLEGRSDSTGDYFDRSVSLDLQVGVPSLNPKGWCIETLLGSMFWHPFEDAGITLFRNT